MLRSISKNRFTTFWAVLLCLSLIFQPLVPVASASENPPVINDPDANGGGNDPDANGGGNDPDANGGGNDPDANGGGNDPDTNGGGNNPDTNGGGSDDDEMPDVPSNSPAPSPRNSTVTMTLDFEDDSRDLELEVVIGDVYTIDRIANNTVSDLDNLANKILPQSDGPAGAWHLFGKWTDNWENFYSPEAPDNRGTLTVPSRDFTLEIVETLLPLPQLSSVNFSYEQVLAGEGTSTSPYLLLVGGTYQIFPRSTQPLPDSRIIGSEMWREFSGTDLYSFVGNPSTGYFDGGTNPYLTSQGYVDENGNHSVFVKAEKTGTTGSIALSTFDPKYSNDGRWDRSIYLHIINPITDLKFNDSLNQVQYDKTISLEDYLTFSPQDTSETAIKWEVVSSTDANVSIDANGNLYTGASAGMITVKATATGYGQDADGSIKAGIISAEITIDATRDPDIYNITFDPMGGSFIDANQATAQTNNQGYITSLPQLADRNGMLFSGWYLDPGYNVRFSTDTLITNDSTIYAGWVQGNYATVEFEANPPAGGSATAAPQFKTIANGTAFGTLPIDIPTAKDSNGKALVFAGWYPNADGSGEALQSSTIINTNITYYAKWEASRSINGDIGWSVIEEVLDLGSPDPAQNPTTPNSGVTQNWTEEGAADEDAGDRDLRYFEVEISGEPLAVGSDIIIVLDKSTSMHNGSRWEDAVAAVDTLAEQLFDVDENGQDNPDNYNRVALVQFSGNTRSSFNFQNSWAGFNNNFDREQPNYSAQGSTPPAADDNRAAGDGTNYTTALRQVIEIIGSRSAADSARPVHVIFVSDGNPETSRSAHDQIVQDAAGNSYGPVVDSSDTAIEFSRTDQNVVEALGLTGEKEAATLIAMGINSYAVGIELAPSKYLTAIANGQQDNVFTNVDSQELTNVLTQIGDSVIAYSQQAHITYNIATAFPNHAIIDDAGSDAEKPAWENGIGLNDRPANNDFANSSASYQINGSTITFDVNSIPEVGLTLGFYAEYTPEDPPVPPTPPTPPNPPVKPPTPPTIPDEPPTVIEEPPTPLAGGVNIEEADTPLGETPTIIITEETPLGQLPQTGAIGISAGNLLLAALSALAIFGLSFKKRK